MSSLKPRCKQCHQPFLGPGDICLYCRRGKYHKFNRKCLCGNRAQEVMIFMILAGDNLEKYEEPLCKECLSLELSN